LSLDQAALTTFLNQKSTELPAPKYLKVDESINAINATLATNNLNTWVRVYHEPTVYTVQAGETLSSIGYDNGIPYPWIQAANPDLGALNPGQQIILPSKDDLLPLPIVKNKRIVVSIPNQEMWAYENGQLLWNWLVSTGIARSPTAPGIFQIQSHDPNAFGAQWNLYMPHFMGVYHPGPGVEVMNGFHGFPTDASGGYLLWTSSLGRPATYGCILLSLENAEALYNWAEEGVVVEIQG
jgi:lipoprotein-anchoring transpeptidase ErfK/SrfK